MAGGAHVLLWRWATEALAVGFADWAALRRVQGLTVEHDPPERAGWPFAAELVLPALRLEARDATGQPWRLRSERIVLRLAPPRPDRLVVRAEGPQRVRIGAFDVPFAARRIEARFSLEAGGPPRATEIFLDGLVAETPDGLLEAGRAQLAVLLGVEPALRVTGEAERVILPENARIPAASAFGREIERLGLDAVLLGPPLQGGDAAAWRAWREAGGVLDIQRAALRWGVLDGEARLALRLDAALQPAGTGTLRLTDPAATLAALEVAGLVAGPQARAIRGIVALMARRPEQGGAPELSAPVAIGDGRLSVARVPLVGFPPIAWRDSPPPGGLR